MGTSVAIDGDTIVAGAPSDFFDAAGAAVTAPGLVYTFARTGAAARNKPRS